MYHLMEKNTYSLTEGIQPVDPATLNMVDCVLNMQSAKPGSGKLHSTGSSMIIRKEKKAMEGENID